MVWTQQVFQTADDRNYDCVGTFPNQPADIQTIGWVGDGSCGGAIHADFCDSSYPATQADFIPGCELINAESPGVGDPPGIKWQALTAPDAG